MNRLILIGNGFDLAHGLKTSYKDFIFWYLDSSFNNAGIYANGHFYEDELVCIRVTDHHKLMKQAVPDVSLAHLELNQVSLRLAIFNSSGLQIPNSY